jgi:hypothetical protein
VKKKASRKRPSRKKNLGKFKSALEKYCSDRLRESGIAFAYEQHTYELMPKFRYPHRYLKMTPKSKTMADRTGSMQHPIKYTPDFVAKDGSWVIETKGYVHDRHDFPMRWKLFLKYLIDNDINCSVYIAKNRQQVDEVIRDILEGGEQRAIA